MTTDVTLPIDWRVSKDYDLPPKWDGVDVEWQGWGEQLGTTREFHRRDRDICERCGSVGRDTYNEGRVAHPMYPYQRHRDVLRLLVWRCIHCQLDTVYDMRTGNLWTLDVTDYGPHGSVG